MTILRNIFELLKEFVRLPRQAYFCGIGVWVLILLSNEYFLYLFSEGAVLSVRSDFRFRTIGFLVNYFPLILIVGRCTDILLIKIRYERENNSEVDK